MQTRNFWKEFSVTGKPYDNVYPYRPKLHAAPATGWHNDPNGMVYADGFYHLYYQWNPYGSMGNMQWGHVKSKDLYHWEQEGLAIAPMKQELFTPAAEFRIKII